MNAKKFFRSGLTKVWFIVSIIVVVLLAAVNVACANQTIQSLLDMYLPGKVTASSENGDLNYYKKEATSKEDAKERGNKLNVKIAEEGITMVKNKNNAFPIAKNSKISVFGKNSANIVYGGSGSGAVDVKEAQKLYESLEEDGFSLNPTLKAFYLDNGKSGSGRPSNPSDLDSGASVTLSTGETPYSSYTDDIISSYSSYDDLALIVFSRIGGEGFDLPRESSSTGKHYLELDDNELKLLSEVTKAGFKKVAVVINSGNPIELGFAESGTYADKIDGVFLMPGTGTTGVSALGGILNGDVNPSGHTVDTYATDFTKAPSYQNFGDNSLTDGDRFTVDGQNKSYYFVDYEEDVYVGYRYYETRGASEGENWYKDNVVYPFGFGLSYTSFSYEIANKSSINGPLNKNEKFNVEVKVKNTGDKAGKGVVEIYGHAPYISSQIQKSEVQLMGLTKTSLLEAGKEETVSIEVNPYYLASYDYKDQNNNDFKGYELDKGKYTFSLRTDSHTVIDSFDKSLGENVRYEKDPITENKVENLYTDNTDTTLNSDYHLGSHLTRDDWNTSFPKTPTASDRDVDKAVIDTIEVRKTNNPNTYETMPTTNDTTTNPDLKLYSLFEKDQNGNLTLNEEEHPYISYDNPKWDDLLNKVSFDDMQNVINNAPFKTMAISSIDKPATLETDGPVGFVNFMSPNIFYGTCAYSSEVMMSQTWNLDLIEEMGRSVGEEGLWGYPNDGRPYSGWYAPGVNIHRSPFGGRNFEYFSEDPLLTGKMAAAEVKGAKSKGVYCYVKHFALNEQETHRQSGGDVSWVSEQAMREIYLRPFEIAVKEGQASGMMSSFNRIGTKWTGGDYRLLTTILRTEWGFKGSVIDDFNTPGYMPVKQMCYAGGDLNLSTTRFWNKPDSTSAGDVTVSRAAIKNVLYMVGNSCAMNGHGDGVTFTVGISPWRLIQIIADCVIPIGLIGWGGVSYYFVKKRPDPLD